MGSVVCEKHMCWESVAQEETDNDHKINCDLKKEQRVQQTEVALVTRKGKGLLLMASIFLFSF